MSSSSAAPGDAIEAPKALWKLALPLVVSFTLRFLFSLVDLAYAAVLDDPNSVSAIGFWMPFNTVYIALWVGLSAGFTASVSQAMGLAREDLVRGLKRAAIRSTGLVVLLLIGLGALFLLVVLPGLQLEQGLIDAVFEYGGILAIGWPLFSFVSIYPDSIVKAHHETKATMVAGLLSTLSNITLNTVFVFVFGWGLAGLAIGTVLSRIPSFLYAHHKARQLEQRRLGQGRQPAAEPSAEQRRIADSLRLPYRQLLWLSLPSAAAFLLTAAELGLFNRLLYELPHPRALYASFAAFHQLTMLAMMPTAAASVAVLPYVARLVSQGQLEILRRQLLSVLGFCLLAALLLSCIPAWFLPDRVAEFFVKADPDPASQLLGAELERAREIASSAFAYLPLLALASVPFFLLRSSFEALGRPAYGLVAGALRFVVFSPVLLWLAFRHAESLGMAVLEGMVVALSIAALAASLFTGVSVARLLPASCAEGREGARAASAGKA